MMKKKYLIFIILLIFCFSVKINIYASDDRHKDVSSPTIPSHSKNESKQQMQKTFVYEQKSIQNVKKKNLKIKVAVSRFEEDLKIEGSMFNPQEETEDVDETIEIKDSKVKIKIDEDQAKEITKSQMLTGLFISALNQTDRFIAVERKNINELIREINFQNSKWTANEAANSLGNIYGIQYIITGDLLTNKEDERFGPKKYTLAARMYDINTGEIISTSTTNTSYLKNAIESAVQKLANKIQTKAWACRVVGVNKEGIYINAGFGDEIEKGDVFLVYRIKGKVIDPETKKVLGVKRDNIGYLEVEEVLGKNLSIAQLQENNKDISIGDIVSAERIKDEASSEFELWSNIYDGSQSIEEEGFEKYSLSTKQLSPEFIMGTYGQSVVKIQTGFSLGSGFIVNPEGYVVTNFHVIDNAKTINIKMIEKKQYFNSIKVIKTDPVRDIALLKINSSETFPAVRLGDSDSIKIGEEVVAIGNPEGFENTIADGLVSGLRKHNGVKLIQTSVPVSHGSSGGPLLNKRGEVIGIVAAGLDKKGNINFAVPINYIKRELLEY
jgi:hypothetical protein